MRCRYERIGGERWILSVYLNKAVMPLSLRLHSFISVFLKFIDTDLYSPQAFPEESNTGHVLLL